MMHFLSSAFYLAIYTAALALHIGSNVYLQTFIRDIEAIFQEIDTKNEVEGNLVEIKSNFINAIQFHDSTMR